MDSGMGTCSRRWSPIIVSTSSCAPDAYSAFPPRHRSQSVSQSVRGREGRVGSTPPGGARQGPIAGYVLQSAAPAGPSPWVYRGVVIIASTPRIAELRSVRLAVLVV